jgi:hypothetical protein
MTIERVFWLVVGVLLLIFAALTVFGTGLNLEQKYVDAIQNFVLGLLALGLALSGWVGRDRVV